ALADTEGALLFIAHGNALSIRTPEGQEIGIEDIRSIRFKNDPPVLLLSCGEGKGETGSPSFARALKDAGASVVVSYAERVDVGDAVAAARLFVDALNGGASVMDALKAIERRAIDRVGPEPRFKVQRVGFEFGPVV